jgi:hypothetical protein
MYSEAFLTDLKSRIAISEIIGRSVKLRRDGKEFRAIDNKSLTINDQKGIWFDHATNEGGDALEWLQKSAGLSFTDAVAEIASLAGVPLPNGDGGRQADKRQPKKNDAANKPAVSAKREIVATYDYTDAQGELIYQVVRLEFMEDGERQKTFRQRRPDPERPSEWIWNLEGVQHGLYRLVDLREAGADEIVFLPEGEKDVETLIGFGLAATTNSGGAKNWRKDHAEAFRGRDVVVLVDNDDPGREHGKTVAASLHGIAARVRVLDFSQAGIWPQAPEGADVSDWVKAREGTIEELAEIVSSLPDAKLAAAAVTEPPAPNWPDDYGAPPDIDRMKPLRSQPLKLTYFDESSHFVLKRSILKGLLVRGETSAFIAPPGAGKSALMTELAIHCASGKDWRGHKAKEACGVVILALERADLYRRRLQAYRMRDGLKGLPIAVAGTVIDLLNPNCIDLIVSTVRDAEKNFGRDVGMVIIDTYAKGIAANGGDEDKARDQNRAAANLRNVQAQLDIHIALVGHTGKVEERGARGSNAHLGDVDVMVQITGEGTKVAEIIKANDQPQRVLAEFKLEAFDLGRDEDGDPITTSIVSADLGGIPPASAARNKPKLKLADKPKAGLRALLECIADGEAPTPADEHVPATAKGVTLTTWRDRLEKTRVINPKGNPRQEFQRIHVTLKNAGVIGIWEEFVWAVT